jgi:hypothetical protein
MLFRMSSVVRTPRVYERLEKEAVELDGAK